MTKIVSCIGIDLRPRMGFDIPPERKQQLKDYSKVDWERTIKRTALPWYAYSTTQLMHMFHTNLRLYEKDRDALDTLLIQTLINPEIMLLLEMVHYVVTKN